MHAEMHACHDADEHSGPKPPGFKGLQENSFLPTLMLVPGTSMSVAPPSPTLTPTPGAGAGTETLVPGALTLTWVSLRPSPIQTNCHSQLLQPGWRVHHICCTAEPSCWEHSHRAGHKHVGSSCYARAVQPGTGLVTITCRGMRAEPLRAGDSLASGGRVSRQQ